MPRTGIRIVSLLVAVGSLWGNVAMAARPAWTTSKIHGSPEAPEPYRLVPAFAKLQFTKPTSIELEPQSDRILVTEMSGKAYTFVDSADVNTTDVVIDLAALSGGPVSLLDAEFHPQYDGKANTALYLCYVHPGDGTTVNGPHTRVSRFTLDGKSPPRVVDGSEQVVITWPSGGHNAGCIEFGPDGLIYIATGDGTGPNPPDGKTTGQDVSDLLGSILRIDIDRASDEQPYYIPGDNPFVRRPAKEARPEVWAYGLRNPWKFGIDAKDGAVFVADNGWETWEMIHRFVAPGGNGGWPRMEGRALLRPEVPVGPTPILPPIKDHSHTEANSVIGGPVYRGGKLPGLDGAFVYGDYITGTIWAVKPDEDKSYSSTTLCDTDQRVIAFAEGRRGELFVLDYDYTGKIYELLPNDVPDTSATFPRRLSETGLFTKLNPLERAPGVVWYSVKVSRWLDGATAARAVAIPGDGKIALSADANGSVTYPEGTVFVEHVEWPWWADGTFRPLETQILHYERGTWRPYSYQWDENGRDATLVESVGTTLPFKAGDEERSWHVGAINECKLCHNAGAKFVLGFTPNQLDFSLVTDPSLTVANQMDRLTAEGVLTQRPQIAVDDPLRLVDPDDKKSSLDDRARSYLHVNCGMCHRPEGNAIVSFYLRRDLPFEKLNTNKGTGIGTFGLTDAKIIAEGDPFRSILLYRMSKLGYARMPYVGSRVVDSQGVSLVAEWIKSRSGKKTDAEALPDAKPQATGPSEIVKTSGSALAAAVAIHSGAMPREIADEIIKAGVAAPSGDIRGLFETFIPESQRRATLGPHVDPQTILSLTGDHDRGKLIFFSDGARCRNCHEIDDRSKSLGPTLQEIAKKYPQATDMVQHVLQPSLKVEDVFAGYAAVTDDGRVLSGMIVEQSPETVVLKTLEKHVVRLARKEIEELKKSDKSLMPERILSDLTAQEAADLLAYIRSQTPAK